MQRERKLPPPSPSSFSTGGNYSPSAGGATHSIGGGREGWLSSCSSEKPGSVVRAVNKATLPTSRHMSRGGGGGVAKPQPVECKGSGFMAPQPIPYCFQRW